MGACCLQCLGMAQRKSDLGFRPRYFPHFSIFLGQHRIAPQKEASGDGNFPASPQHGSSRAPHHWECPMQSSGLGDGTSLPHPKSPPWAGAGQPGALLAMHSTCFLSGYRSFWLHYVMSGVTLAAFCSLIKHSSNRGGMVKEKVDGGSGRGKYACDKQVNGNLCADG